MGRLGAVLAYLALAIAGLTTLDPRIARAVYLCLELIGWRVIVPLSLASVGTGLVQSAWGSASFMTRPPRAAPAPAARRVSARG